MNSELSTFLAGMFFEKLNRLLRVCGDKWNSGDEFNLGIHLPEGTAVDVGLIEKSFYNMFQMFNIHDAYTVDIRCEFNVANMSLRAVVKLYRKEGSV